MSQNDFTAENSQKKSIKLGRRLSQKPLSQKRYILWGLLILWLPDITRKMTAIHMSQYSCIIGDVWSPTSLRGNHSKEKCKVKAREVHSLSKTSLKYVFISVLFSRISKTSLTFCQMCKNHCRIKSQMGNLMLPSCLSRNVWNCQHNGVHRNMHSERDNAEKGSLQKETQ